MYRRLIAAAAVLALVTTACGGGADDGDDPAAGVTTTQAAPGSTAASTDDGSTDSTDPGPGTTAPPTTTIAATPTVELAELPALVESAAAAVGDPTVDPLSIAQQVFGFPFAVPSPDGSSLHNAEARLAFVFEGDAGWSFEYQTVAADGIVPDVDITLDGNGPGSEHIIEVYDPIMASLGFTRANSTASDPGDPGGPNSVNHVYPPDVAEVTVNGVEGTVPNVKIWLDEDVVDGDFSDDIDIAGGYRFEHDFDTTTDAAIPVPLLAAVAEVIPRPDDAVLVEARVRLNDRPADAFLADRGLNYLAVEFVWELPGNTIEDAPTLLDDALFTDPDVFTPGMITTLRGGGIDTVIDRREGSDGRLDLDTVLLRRYEGILTVSPNTNDGPIRLRYSVDLNPVSPEQDLLAE